MPQLVSYVENPVHWDTSADHDSFTVSGLDRLRGVSKGVGLLHFFWASTEGYGTSGSRPRTFFMGLNDWHGEFVLLRRTAIDYVMKEPDVATVIIDSASRVPCSGIIAGTGDGYIIAPAIRFDVPEGRDVVLMLILPTTTPHEISVDKTTLDIPDEATVTLSTGSGELRCAGSVFGHGVKAARLVLNRNPGLPVFPAGFNENLCELNGVGQISVVWRPVARNIAQCLIALYPSELDSLSYDSFQRHLGAPEDDYSGNIKDYVVGDGIGTDYTIRLVLDRGLGRHSSNEARLIVT